MSRPLFLTWLFAVIGCSLHLTGAVPTKQSNINLGPTIPTTEMIQSQGYPIETHHVITEDGYVLGVHRIPYGKAGPSAAKRTPVFLMHGLLGASSNFVAIGSNYSIGFNLADAGFDVWLGNARGSRDSRQHVTLNPDDEQEKFKFWDFSWEEIALYDIPSMTDYVREVTGFEKIHYIGHSQGTTVFFVLNSLKPEYNDKFLSAHLLAPVSFKRHFPNTLLGATALLTDTIYGMAVRDGFVEVGQNVIDDLNVEDPADATDNIWYNIIREYLEATSGDEPVDTNLFGGSAIKQIAHYGQNIRSRSFQRWDYGIRGNNQAYGSWRAPQYDITKVTVPIVLHYTVADSLAGVGDVLEMERVLPNAEARRLASDYFTHVGFANNPAVKDLVTTYIIQKLKSILN